MDKSTSAFIEILALMIEKQYLIDEYKSLELKNIKTEKDLIRMNDIRTRIGKILLKAPHLFIE